MKHYYKYLTLVLSLFIIFNISNAQKKDDKKDKKKGALSSGTFSALKFRSIGPAYASGRIADFAVNPKCPSEYYVAVAAGNVWKTSNAGLTWKAIFDNYGSYSIADVEIDPNNKNVVWVGTGEYNSQRAIGYGDGVYRSENGGKSFKNMGLKKSEHIGRIIIDPRNSHVYVAAQGPLWGKGGDRGLYKSEDDGKTWKKILNISENTGLTDIVMDPRNPDILYAASYQRRRHVFTLINGGPESAIYKSKDAGKTWTKLKSGLPSGDVGRIGLTISPVNPDFVFAIIEAAGKSGGFYRSTNRGVTWKKMSNHVSNSPQYYNRIYADPKDVDKVFSMNTYTMYTLDGGKKWKRLGQKQRHVDDHALWIDPKNTNHLLIGGDGGIYESYDHGANWHHKPNLPVTQYYRVSIDNSKPFYYVHGGTQDNNSMGGPSRTISADGITNADWFNTQGGDGFFSAFDPKDPNIVYAEAQYGYLTRYDRKSGDNTSIMPAPPKGEAYRWNWNAPLILSSHLHTRLYFAANKLFKSNDRGNSWEVISPDLTRQINRNNLKVMDIMQSPEAVAKNASTSLFGNIVSLSESPKNENLLYVGTDDGLIQVTEDGGDKWKKYNKFPDVKDMTYVSAVLASQHDENVVYAAFDGRKNNDLKPHILKSTNKGKSWTSISSNLPDRGTVYAIAEDHVKKDLLFAGTEFGFYFSIDGGKKWIKLKSGLPTIAVRDIKLHKRENDIVIATFGRGFYIVDDYTPLRFINEKELKKESIIFPIKDALMYVQKRARYGQGADYYSAKNPKYGAVFTYYFGKSIKTKKQIRKKIEKKALKNKSAFKYPTFEELRIEDEQEKPFILFTIKDADGNIVRKLHAPASKGLKRIVWDFNYASTQPVRKGANPFSNKGFGIPIIPGKYNITMSKVVDGVETKLYGAESFNVKSLNNSTLPAKNRKEVLAFQKKTSELARTVFGAVNVNKEMVKKIKAIRTALYYTSKASKDMLERARKIEIELKEISRALTGDRSISKRNGNQAPSIRSRVFTAFYGLYRSNSEPTQTMKKQYEIAAELFEPEYKKLKNLIKRIEKLETEMEAIKAPWTHGRLPKWNRE